ncbi:LLM class F420-dependent oxidoreductase [Amycolatopsis sp. GM8]|uniref:LLM class F420-dependent oxidoreductase n=1 Tax=Amycolatopsis sp. GM8 TaxID=2896530 RepID=UPI001F3B59A8|nr:LLM class F420-dependent oxidoreductase [Amycolatopsis sp. GM8]
MLPTTEIGADTGAVAHWAAGADECGFDAIVLYDHVVGAEHQGRTPPITRDYDERTSFREPFVLLGYLAAVTRTVELMTGVLVLPQRQTALVAKQAAEVSLLSGGRFTLGVGIGWNVVEYDALGMSFGDRGRRLDEQVRLLRMLWADDVVSLDGRFHRIDRVAISPRPDKPIPLVFGGGSATALRRAARLGDGFLFNAPSPEALDLHATLDAQLAGAGRAREGFRVLVQVHACHGEEQLRHSLAPWRGRDVDDVVISTMRNRMIGATADVCDGAEEHLALLRRTREIVREVLGD